MAPRFLSASEAAELVKDNDTLALGGLGGVQFAEGVVAALEVRFLTTGYPQNLTWFDPSPTGLGEGYEHLAHEGLLKRLIASWFGGYHESNRLILENRVEGYAFPLSTCHLWARAAADGRSGYLTQAGLGAYVDPRLQGGKLNSRTTEELVQVVTMNGAEHLYYRPLPINVTIIRGSIADEEGNISFEEEPANFNAFNLAAAAKAWGGTVIAQVRAVAAKGSLNPRMVFVPGLLVDVVVVEPSQKQNEVMPDRHIEGLDGRVRVPPPRVEEALLSAMSMPRRLASGAPASESEPFPLSLEKIIARRVVQELVPGMAINCGFGIPMLYMIPVTLEEGIQQHLHIVEEHGILGGINTGGVFHLNPSAMFDNASVGAFFHSGGLNMTALAYLEVDAEGNVNLSGLPGRLIGPGGAIDIAHTVNKVFFTGTFTAGGLRANLGNGQLRIEQEASTKRWVRRVYQVTFSGREMLRKGQDVYYVSERAVFRLSQQGPVLTEIAPGVDIERDIIGQMEFRPGIAPDLKLMDHRLFRPQRLALDRDMEAMLVEAARGPSREV